MAAFQSNRFGISLAVFGALIRAYPTEFRRRFAAQMLEDFRDLLAATAESSGPTLGRCRAWRRSLFDLVRSLPREYFRLWFWRSTPHGRNRPSIGDHLIRSVIQDFRYALRGLRKAPAFTIVAVLTLTLGIGANTAIFTLVNGILLRPPPFRDPAGILAVWQRDLTSDDPTNSISPATFRDFEQQNTVFEHLAAFYATSITATQDGEIPERIEIARVLPGFFAVLGTEPLLGRTFRDEERQPGNHRVTILSSGFWGRRYRADSSVIGTTITLNRVDYEIVGIMPPGIDFPRGSALWLPIAYNEGRWNNRGAHFLSAVGRLAPGATLDLARTELETIAARVETERWGVAVLPLHDDMVGHIRPALLLLQGAVLLVLLIACVNVANLQLARGSTRQGEFAIRTALGAGRGRLVRFLLAESLVLAGFGAALGLLLAWGITDAARAFAPDNLADIHAVTLDRSILVFTAVVAVLTGFVFGLTPALQASKTDISLTLKEGGRGATPKGRRLRETLVVVEIGLSLVLLVGAGLLINSFGRLINVDSGVDPENALTVRVTIPASVYSEAIDRASFFERLHRALEELPNVESAALTSELPITGVPGLWRNGFYRPESPPESSTDEISAYIRWISPAYLETVGIPLLRGRSLNEGDRIQRPKVILIDQTMARQFFPNEDPLGKRLLVQYNDWNAEIVGIVGNTQQASLNDPLGPHIYLPYLQTYEDMFVASMAAVLRTRGNPLDLVDPVRDAVLALDSDLAPSQIETLEQRIANSVGSERFNLILVSGFAAVALVLSAVGLYGVVAYLVGQRTRELGLRMALGARGGDVLSMVLRHGAALTVIGIAIGLAGVLAMNRVLSQFLFGVSATDPLTIAVVTGLLAGVTLVAAVVPARRASMVDPVTALR